MVRVELEELDVLPRLRLHVDEQLRRLAQDQRDDIDRLVGDELGELTAVAGIGLALARLQLTG